MLARLDVVNNVLRLQVDGCALQFIQQIVCCDQLRMSTRTS